MNDAFLTRYESELAYFRETSGLFADQYPKIAGRLRLDANTVEDPHVSRLIEAFAFLTARTRLKLDDEFPEICEAMLNALYPHYLAPFPPVMMVQLQHNSPQSMESLDGTSVPRGTRFETESVQGEPCRFRTCYATKVWPLAIESVIYSKAPFSAPQFPNATSVEAILKIRIKRSSNKIKLPDLNLNQLRFFVNGDSSTAGSLFENILRDAVGVAIGLDNQWQFLPGTALQPAGFLNEESLLEHSPRQLSAYRILTEFFCFPEKFRFVDFDFQETWKSSLDPATIEIIVYLSRSIETLERNVEHSSLVLSCTPGINSFFQRAEPIRLNELQAEHLVVPNARRTRTMEVLSIDRVTARTAKGQNRTYFPFYASSHEAGDTSSDGYWYATRRPAQPSAGESDRGSEVYLCLVDLNGRRMSDQDWTLDVETTCLNRDLVARLPSRDRMKLSISEGGGQINVTCVVPPTPTYRLHDNTGYHWRLISQLSLNQLSLVGAEGVQSLREILRLYNPSDSPATRNVIESVQRITYDRKSAVARVRGGPGSGLCRGIDIDVWLDPDKLVGAGPFVFALVLERFFGLFATLNSFTRTRVRFERSEVPLLAGHPRAGQKSLF